jgi:hypothetical protein
MLTEGKAWLDEVVAVLVPGPTEELPARMARAWTQLADATEGLASSMGDVGNVLGRMVRALERLDPGKTRYRRRYARRGRAMRRGR